MNRAHQLALFQSTNQGILNIRNSEITYYINLNNAFGTQAALIGGFTFGVFTQNKINNDTSYSTSFSGAYWIASAITIAFSVHVIISTMLLQVLGPGLALNGPLGSMTRAAEGLRIEQRQIIVAFILMMIAFAISTVLSFWMVMTLEGALGSTLSFMIAARYWYFYSERIYLRFYWNFDKSGWHANDDDSEDSLYDIEPDHDVNKNPMIHNLNEHRASLDRISKVSSHTEEARTLSNESTKSKRNKRYRFFNFTKSQTRKSEDEERKKSKLRKKSREDILHEIFSNGGKDPNTFLKAIAMEGYLTKKQNSSSISTSKSWERRYFTMNNLGQLYYYKSRQRFKRDPKNPLNKRPLILSDYNISIQNSEAEIVDMIQDEEYNSVNSDSIRRKSTNTLRSSGNFSKDLFFQITMSPKAEIEDIESGSSAIKRSIILRCDIEEELDIWVNIMKQISPESFNSSPATSFINISQNISEALYDKRAPSKASIASSILSKGKLF